MTGLWTSGSVSGVDRRVSATARSANRTGGAGGQLARNAVEPRCSAASRDDDPGLLSPQKVAPLSTRRELRS
jgi:hypothetical protein